MFGGGDRLPDVRQFVRILALPEPFDQVGRRTPLPLRGAVEQTLEVAMQKVGGFEAQNLGVQPLERAP